MKNVLATLAVSATTGEWIVVYKLIRLMDFRRSPSLSIMHKPAERCWCDATRERPPNSNTAALRTSFHGGDLKGVGLELESAIISNYRRG